MVIISKSVEIAAAPEKVRATFFDFAKMPTWTTFFKSIESPKPPSELHSGDKITVTVNGMGTFSPIVMANDASYFAWTGAIPFLFSGAHRFDFEPSKTTPGSTTFTNSEEFTGLLSFMMSSWLPLFKSTEEGFARFCNELKQHIESGSTS